MLTLARHERVSRVVTQRSSVLFWCSYDMIQGDWARLQAFGSPYGDRAKHLRRGVDLENGYVLVGVIALLRAVMHTRNRKGGKAGKKTKRRNGRK